MLPLITKAQTTWYSVRRKAGELIDDTDGATAIEYGLIAAGIAVAIIAAVFALGDEIKNFFTGVQGQIQSKTPN